MSSVVLDWYRSVGTRVVDLVGDYAGKELFLLEGDSLLLECFQDKRLDFEDGFQLLHAVYIVETFLENLIKRKCNFRIIFFDAHAELCIPSPSPQTSRSRYLLARSAIIHHLISHLSLSHPALEVAKFPTFNCPAFRHYLDSAGVYFVMCHDGSKARDLAAPKLQKGGEGETTPVQDNAARVFRDMIFWLMMLGLNVALVNELEWRDSKIFARVVDGGRHKRQHAKDIANLPTAGVAQTDVAPGGPSIRSLAPLWDLIKLHGGSYSERDYLTVFCLSEMLKQGSVNPSLASAVLLHLSCSKCLSIAQRRIRAVNCNKKDHKAQFTAFLTDFSDNVRTTMDHVSWRKLMKDNSIQCDVADLIDVRLLQAILRALDGGSAASLIHGPVLEKFNSLCAALSSLHIIDLSLSEQDTTATQTAYDRSRKIEVKSAGILPFSNPVFDQHLASIHISANTAAPMTDQTNLSVLIRENSHWHNAKRLLDPKKSTAGIGKPSRRWNPLRSNQIFMAEMTAYAASLTNARGKQLTPESISASAAKSAGSTAKSGKDQKEKKQSKQIGSSKADRIIAENKAKKEASDASRTFAAWDTIRGRMDKLEPQSRYLEANAYIDRLETAKAAVIQVDILMYCLQALLYCWAGFCKYGRKDDGYKTVALIWDTIRRLRSPRVFMIEAASKHLDDVCSLLGVPQPESTPQLLTRPLSFDFQIPSATNGTLSIDMPPQEFQLLHCGPYMDRHTDARPDPRIASFEPDGWQRKVLDELDANNSVFVVAPTSAGKTFISFYAMEKVLRESDDGILVYVAPTKALVNQIAAEVHGRFSKKYLHAEGHSVWAIHTRDYRVNNPSGCQVLVTVPHILQIMLLAPSNARSWAPRVKRIIFDEIHSIGQADDGVVWEQLLLLAPCPIIALSATIGNPEEFNEWLAATQKAAGIQLTMIQHKQRYSDLRKSVYSPPKEFLFTGLEDLGPATGLLGLDNTTNLRTFHPIASLVNKSRGIPDDLSLEARDCFALWKSMVKHQTQEFPMPGALDPKTALPIFIKKADVFTWEAALKTLLVNWMSQSSSPFDKVLEDLSSCLYSMPSEGVLGPLEASRGPTTSDDDVETIDPNDLCSTTLPLLMRLHERDALPAIFFNYDRLQCEQIAKAVFSRLEAAEARYKTTNAGWKKLVEGLEQWKKAETAKEAAKPAKPIEKRKKGKGSDPTDDLVSKSNSLREAASEEKHPYDSFDPNEPLNRFSFANNKKYDASLLKNDIQVLTRKGVQSWLGKALKRGIGVHHAGMNRKYRQIVEVLFRKGYLRVVIATGTLSLGINMPCTTVVFSGDSVFLTALNFRQAAGRAGRRGFDLLGNVVFQGLSMGKVCRLLSSRLPDLNGHFPITTTLVLRLFTLLHVSGTSPYAVRAINSLLSQPRIYLGGESFKEQVLHHLRFSIEYLRKQSLLGFGGEPINFAECVSHLYYTENSSFAFHAILRGGYFHSLCANTKSHQDLMRNMMIVMAHLFGRQRCRNVQREFIDAVVLRSPSIVFLPPMPKRAVALLREHNEETLATFTTYVETFAAQHLQGEDRRLPLTGINVGGDGNSEAATALGVLSPSRSRSAFVALSGHGDNFESISDLCTTVRRGIFLEQSVVPALELSSETNTPLNAYLYDFFMHGQLGPLEEANGIRKSDIWFYLNDFSMVLATIVTSLANFLHLKATVDTELIDIVGSGDALEIDEDERLADDDDAGDTDASIALALKSKQVLPTPKAAKVQVAESWDDEEEEVDDGDNDTSSTPSDWGGDSEELGNGSNTGDAGLLQVYKAFVRLKVEFDEKFKLIWA